MEPKIIDQVFWDAARLASPGERAAYLDRACAGDPDLRRQVEELLAARSASGSFLETPAVARPGRAVGDGDTRTGPAAPDGDLPLGFLTPSGKPGSLGRLGHYEVQGVVGRGGMGIVLKAFDENLHRVVAIKVMAPQLAASATARQRFTREARAAAAVTHERVVTIHAVEEASGLPYIVMQYVAGQSLQDRLDKSGVLPVAEVLRIGMQAAAGLAAAHAQGLVHRDVKPANILLENGVERVKLTDFGLARAADDASLTQSGQVAGTPQYMSPEQAEGKPVDARSDLFCLGSVLYAMCAGRPPFRAPTSMAVLKRVCEDTPTPIREVNPEAPDWLAEVITKLHAKDPAGRFQSAAEVAESLGRHLAHVQHPSVVPLPAAGKPAAPPPPAAPVRPTRRGRRWATAAAVLLLLLAGLGTTEATGVTKLRATVIRIFTPDGTLVVEADDPDVKVAVEGTGDLVITGAGVREVRLPPGSYKLRATRDGKPVPLDRDLVTITRGDRQIVRVRLEGEALAAATPKVGAGVFVVLSDGGRPERTFGTLAEAIVAADGAVIEVRGNGPFAIRPITIKGSLVTIRAGAGFRPVFELAAEDAQAPTMIRADAPLVLEGLEFRRSEGRVPGPYQWKSVLVVTKGFDAANCRFLTRLTDVHVVAKYPSLAELKNSEFLGTNAPGLPTYAVQSWPGRDLVLDNCLSTGNITTNTGFGEPVGAAFRLTRNTIRPFDIPLRFYAMAPGKEADQFAKADWSVKALRLEASGNVFDATSVFEFGQKTKTVLPPGQAEACLVRMVSWQGERNVYPASAALLHLSRADPWVNLGPPKLPAGLAGWKQLWGTTETGSIQGRVHYMGGDLLAKAQLALEKITPEDFRLLPGSAGYRAGKDGKDLGADVDLVGPGAGYERWKKTPDYQQWLKDTGQKK
jgi:hypothetical protein